MNWTYEGNIVTEMPKDVHGFVYLLTYEGNYKYIGMKATYSILEKPAKKSGEIREGCERVYHNVIRDEDGKVIVSRKDIRAARKRGLKATREAYDRGIYEAKWQDYESSSKDVANYTLISKEILEYGPTLKSLRYLEESHLFKNDVLLKPEYLNQNIGGRYFKGLLL